MRPSLLACALIAAAVASGAHAAGLRLAVDHSARLPVAGPAASVVVGNPNLIDVSVVDSRTVFVSGKAPGSTDVTVIDPLGRIVYRGDVVIAAGAPVTVFRGAKREDATCAPFCSAAVEGGGADPSGGSAAASAGVGPIASAVGALKGSSAAGLGSVGAAVAPR